MDEPASTRGMAVARLAVSHSRDRLRPVNRDELQQRSLEAAVGEVGIARVEFDDVAGWLAASGASPGDPLAVEVWLFDADLSRCCWCSIGGGAGSRPVGKLNLERHPARGHAVSRWKRSGWTPSSSPGRPP